MLLSPQQLEGVPSPVNVGVSYLHCTLDELAAEVRKVRKEAAALYTAATWSTRGETSGRPTAKIRECLAV